MDFIQNNLNYWVFILLLMIGLFAMISKRNLIKKLIGMSIFQSAVILFFVSTGVKENSRIPIILHQAHHPPAAAGDHHNPAAEDTHSSTQPIDPDRYANPLPHVLMLTAIVVGVATLGLGLALSQKIFGLYGTLEEDELIKQLTDG